MEKSRIIILLTIVCMVISGFLCTNFINNRYQVKFNCGKNCDTKIKYVKKGSSVKVIDSPRAKNKVFIEWQLNGKKYNFNNKVTKNIELKARWLPEIYVNVTIKDGINNNTIKLLAGNNIQEYIKNPKKEGYKFLGWYVNDKKYDITKTITSDTIIEAKWLYLEKVSHEIGDEVLITGKYANDAYSMSADNSVAIGWTRKIIAIYEGANYKYALGNESGITGYFNENSFSKTN